MAKDLIKKLHETFGDLKTLTPSKINEFVEEALVVFEELHQGISSNNLEEREKSLALANQLKAAFQEQSEKICLASGVSRDMLHRELLNPDNFNDEEFKMLDHLSENLREIRSEKTAKETKKKKHKSQIIRLVG